MNLAERAAATEIVLDRYRDKPFSWAGANCIRLARAQAAAFGHAVPPVPLFRTATGARRALRRQGAASVSALLDKYLPALPTPAFMLVGDLCVLRGDDTAKGLEAVCISDGLGSLFGWHDIDPSRMVSFSMAEQHITRAWRL